jgi:hypothetical protein
MFEVKLTLISKSESLLGILFDQGEYQKRSSGQWVPFTRIRLGVIFLTLDIVWYSM